MRDTQEHVEALRSTFRESRLPNKFSSYMVLISIIIDSEPTSVEEGNKPSSLEVCHDGGVSLHYEE